MTRYNLYNSLTPEEQKLVVKPYDYGGTDSQSVFEGALEYFSDTDNITYIIRDKNGNVIKEMSHYEHYYSSYIDAQKGKN